MYFMKEMGPVEFAKVLRECSHQNGVDITISDMLLHRICGDIIERIVQYAPTNDHANQGSSSEQHPASDPRQLTLFEERVS